ncbi:MAG: circularly permuted type 2 ATP-grasp protein [Magnetospiraceae bacterium]
MNSLRMGKEAENLGKLIDGYRPLPGVLDELVEDTGAIRPLWADFMGRMSRYSTEEITSRFRRGNQYLRDAGVFFRQYSEGKVAERDWPLSHLPVMISGADWEEIARGLIQRADLLESIVADLYGDNRLVQEGYLPAQLVAEHPEWLRPMVGIRPVSGYFLHFLAFEIGRGPDGRWWVLGDRTQAPSGAGFALENRVATMRIFPEMHQRGEIYRLAGFFRVFREALLQLRNDPASRAAILTPGPMTDTYYEHTYIARYLGLMLLEGEDLRVDNGRLMVRTVSGLKPVSVLWRRLDAAWADPLELVDESQLGTAGLVGAIRDGNVTMVNALGAGILEARGMLAFIPRICEALRGEQLIIPNIATWWCGQEAEKAYVRENIDKMMISSALSTSLPLDNTDVVEGWRNAEGARRQSLDAWLDRDSATLVGQEAATLSTTPTFRDGKLIPRTFSLRMFLARTATGWQVMPGGFARVGSTDDATAIAMRQGGAVADVWVMGPGAARDDSLLPAPFARYQPTVLPSRAADNLFWLGRYIERSEWIMRLARAYHERLAESGGEVSPLIKRIQRHLKYHGVAKDELFPQALNDTLGLAVNSASKIRDRFSDDGWMALSDLQTTALRLSGETGPASDVSLSMGLLLRRVAGFSGLIHENMYRFTGWRFLTIGRSMERALSTLSLIATFADPDAPDGAYDLALEVADSLMSQRRRFSVATTRESVVDLLALDSRNPRSVLHHINEVYDQAALLPEIPGDPEISALSRAVLRIQTNLRLSAPESLGTKEVLGLMTDVAAISPIISDVYLQ